MFPCSGFGFGYWWIFPIIMIGMMVLCFFMMRGRMSSMMCGHRSGNAKSHDEHASECPLDILNRRYAKGEIDKLEYQEKKAAVHSNVE
jgi:uncharacterized membrane protein